MLKIGTVVNVVGPKSDPYTKVRDIWWNNEMNRYIGKNTYIEKIEDPYDPEEPYDGVVYVLSGCDGWWFVDEWLLECKEEEDADILCERLEVLYG